MEGVFRSEEEWGCYVSPPASLRSAVESTRARCARYGDGPRSYLVKSLYTPAIKNTALQSGYWARAFPAEYN